MSNSARQTRAPWCAFLSSSPPRILRGTPFFFLFRPPFHLRHLLLLLQAALLRSRHPRSAFLFLRAALLVPFICLPRTAARRLLPRPLRRPTLQLLLRRLSNYAFFPSHPPSPSLLRRLRPQPCPRRRLYCSFVSLRFSVALPITYRLHLFLLYRRPHSQPRPAWCLCWFSTFMLLHTCLATSGSRSLPGTPPHVAPGSAAHEPFRCHLVFSTHVYI